MEVLFRGFARGLNAFGLFFAVLVLMLAAWPAWLAFSAAVAVAMAWGTWVSRR